MSAALLIIPEKANNRDVSRRTWQAMPLQAPFQTVSKVVFSVETCGARLCSRNGVFEDALRASLPTGRRAWKNKNAPKTEVLRAALFLIFD